MTKDLNDAIQKALTTTAGAGGDFLPTPLAREFVKYVRDKNWLRQAFKTVSMNSKTRDYPKILGNTKVYYQATEGGAATQTGMTTATLRLTAKKFMSQLNLAEEVIEDAQEDMESIAKDHFADQLAAAEEEAMIVGDTAHSDLTATESSASGTTWFTKDHRLIWNGLLTLSGDLEGTLANGNRAAARVNGAGGEMTASIARQLMFQLGKYGRVMQDLVLILNPWSSNQILDDAKLVTIDKYGPKATIMTGEIGKLYGKITVINSPYCTDGYGVITHRLNPIIGDRRLVKIAKDKDITTDTRLFVITERADFMVQYQDALSQLYNIELASDAS